MTKGAIFIRKQGDDEPRDATSPLEGYEYIGVVDGDVTFTTDGVEATGETFSADDASHLLDGSMTATIEDVDENLMRKLSGWTVLMAEDEETRLRTFHRVYTLDYERMRRDGGHKCPVHPPTLILPFDTPNLERAISAWLDIDEGPGRDFAYVREDEPDYLHVVSALGTSFGIGRHWMEHDL